MMAADKEFAPTLFGFSDMAGVTKKIYRLSVLTHYPDSHFCCRSLYVGAVKMMYIKALLKGKDEDEATKAALQGVNHLHKLKTFTTSMNSTTDRIQNYMSQHECTLQFEDLPSHIVHPELPKNFYASYAPMNRSSRSNDSRLHSVFHKALLNIAKGVHAVMPPQHGRNNTAIGKADADRFVSDIARIFYKSKRCHESFSSLILSMTRMNMEVAKAQRIIVRLLLLKGTMRAADPYNCSAPADLVQYYSRALHDKKYELPQVPKVP
jgi:hypothetical protein